MSFAECHYFSVIIANVGGLNAVVPKQFYTICRRTGLTPLSKGKLTCQFLTETVANK
jgi:hypothetical protein